MIVSGASTGELERFADICHEYELPYRLGELEENVTVARLAEEGSTEQHAGGNGVIVKAPLAEGVVFSRSAARDLRKGGLFETLPPRERQRARPKTASFFSDSRTCVRAITWSTWIMGSDNSKDCGRWWSKARPANSCCCIMRGTRSCTCRSRASTWCRNISRWAAGATLDRLGTTVWEARKSRVRKSVDDMADQLLALYAERKTATGHAFPADSNWQREFEDAFEFEETADQQRAIEDVKHDMESTIPMDRLLCGDVGYGKTEVAMRAAFKSVDNGTKTSRGACAHDRACFSAPS